MRLFCRMSRARSGTKNEMPMIVRNIVRRRIKRRSPEAIRCSKHTVYIMGNTAYDGVHVSRA